jgi:hypothetical protein
MSRDANTPARLTSRARHVLNRPRIESTRRARSAAAPALGRELSHDPKLARHRGCFV